MTGLNSLKVQADEIKAGNWAFFKSFKSVNKMSTQKKKKFFED